jgi:hypothetical protein
MPPYDANGFVLCAHGRPIHCIECGDEYAHSLSEHGRAARIGASLEATIERGALVVRIGIQTLAHAVTYSDWANPYDEATGDYVRSFAIVDAPQFASDVINEMLREREDGSTPLSDFIDRMSEAAVNDGSLGLHEDFDHRIKHGEKSPLETW